MATVPPIYSFPSVYYNPVFFPSISGYLTLSQANALYLARTGIASSVAITTSFTGSVVISGLLTLSGGLSLTGGLIVDNLTVNALSTLNTNTIINNILTINATNSIIGQTTFSLIPILPAGYQFLTTGAQTITGIKTFLSIPTLPTGYQFLTTTAQTIDGIKTFSSPIVSSGASIAANSILSSSIVNSSITQTQIASPYSLLNSGSAQTILGDKILNGTNTTNDMILNIFSAFSGWNGTIGCIPACTTNYLNLTTTVFDSMLYIGQSIGSGPNQPYGFCICDYNSGGTGIRISGTGAPGNCSISLNGTVSIAQLLTLEGGLFCDIGNITTPNNGVIGNMFCDIYNNYNQTTGTDISLNPNNFVTCLVNAGNNSILPSAPIGFGGLKIGYNCSTTSGESDFINLANYTNTGGFNFYTMNASSLPSLIGSLTSSYLTINGSLKNNFINNSLTLPYSIISPTTPTPSTVNGSSGLQIGWNGITGTGGTDFINLCQGGVGGFYFSAISASITNRLFASIGTYNNYGLWLYSNAGRLRIDDRNGGSFWWSQSQEGSQMQMSNNGISTSITLGCGNASGVGSTCLSISTGGVSPNVNFNPLSTSTFNVSHPTTSLGNNISTNTTQYATVGYVNSSIPTSLLTTNNTFSGTNTFNGTLTTNSAVFLSVGAQITGAITLPSNMLEYYYYTATTAYTITIPNPVGLKGLKVIFRRYSTNTAAITLSCAGGLIVAPNTVGLGTTSYIMAIGTFTSTFISDNGFWQGL